jgi:phosphoribosyl 1,2-cyclic phosphodiesterase
MKFTPIASSSKGNAYLVEADGVAPLLLEAGIPISQLREKLKFGITKLAGCLISHAHGDHSKSVKEVMKAGVDTYMSQGTIEALYAGSYHRARRLKAAELTEIGPWRVLPFELVHDAPEPLGFFIAHEEDRLLFIPDTAYSVDRFEGVTIAAIEANYIDEILSANILRGSLPPVVGHRTRRNHMSLKTLIELLKANDLSRCQQIWLLHLSDGNSDEKRMIMEVQRATGIPTRAA